MGTAVLIFAFLLGWIVGWIARVLWKHLFWRFECVCGYRAFWSHNMLHHIDAKHSHKHRGTP
jgi:hypothetical protein